MISLGRCTEEPIIEKKTVHIGDDVNLTCIRRSSGTLFWTRLVSGEFPEVLGKTFSFENAVHRITTSINTGEFNLHIAKAQRSDTAVYYCMKIQQRHFTFLKATVLRVEGADVTAVPTSPTPPEQSVSRQCSLLCDTENKMDPEEKAVCCFRAGSHQSHLTLNYTQGDGVYEYDENPEKHSAKKCICSFLQNVSSSDAGTYFCAVATCGEIFSRNGSKLDTEGVNARHLQKDSTVLILLCAALAVCLLVIAFLIYSIKNLKKKSTGCYAAVALETTATAKGYQESLETDVDSLVVYSAPTFSKKPGKAATREAKTAEKDSIYADVRALGLD